MKWFKSRKQKKIEELQFEIAQLKAKENQILIGMEEKMRTLIGRVDMIKIPQQPTIGVYPRVERKSLQTEALVVKFTVPHDMPLMTDDIEARVASLLSEQVAKYMIVQKEFMRDPLADDVYRAMVKVVPYPVEEKRFYEMG